MMKCRRLILCVGLLAVVFGAPAAFGQDAYAIDSVGTATVDVAPATVVFQLELLPGAGPAVDLLQQAVEFETNVRAEIQKRGLTPTQIAFSGLNYMHPDMLGPNASAYLRFSTTQYAVGEGADQKYAVLHDEIAAIAAAAKARTFPETYEASDPEQVEAAAIARAVEKAYPPAKAAADVMGAKIVSVGNVSVGTLVWSSTASPAADYNIRRITCTATVNASYIYLPGP
jgi:uncharacterized protein YggE